MISAFVLTSQFRLPFTRRLKIGIMPWPFYTRSGYKKNHFL